MYKVEKEHGFFWHWQNLKKEDSTKHLLNGRAWLHHRPGGVFGVQWVIPSGNVHVDLTVGGCEDQLRFSVALGLFALYFSFERWSWLQKLKVCADYHERQIGLSWFMHSLHWRIWTDPMEYHFSTPKWRDGWFDVSDFFLGRNKYTKVDQEPIPATISMPEGEYPATVTFFTQTWKRPRWPWPKVKNGADVDIEGGIPIPGKGENSWDCDEDAYMSIGTSATTVEEAVQNAIESVNKRRVRYGGKNWLPEKTRS